jgi:hypothetical protein
MKLAGVISTAVLSLTLGMAAPLYAQQEQHDQQDEQKAKPEDDKKAQPDKPKQEERNAQQENNIKPEEKNAKEEKITKPEEKNTQQQNNNKQDEKNTKSTQRAEGNGGGRIPEDRYKANFGQAHTFRVNQGEYGNRRFQYGGYWFGFVGAWPSNWLYTQDVYVIEINGVYYLCNAMYPGVNIALSVTI